MKNRNIKSESDFINGATSLPKKESTGNGRKRSYKAISASLTESHIDSLDDFIKNAAVNGHLGITRSDVIKAAIELFTAQKASDKLSTVLKIKSGE